ncbi:transmembrane protein 130 [Gouania willdenowi]|uniref:PKD domain-containing protein n=1 Tax=Gouania willdenowi TaxID=441366 RepID=A0A8C5E1M2_GOUWI|nr:transmembrane protein 130 [Gouania willdenowi]
MDKNSAIWIWMILHTGIVLVAETKGPLTELENVAGKLIFYQMEGNTTIVRDKKELASDVPTKTLFEPIDPKKNLTHANFTYTWDLGNGKVIRGNEPVVRYNYPQSGNYTLQLKVGANMTNGTTPMSEVYSTDVQVLDPIKNITMSGQSEYEVSRDVNFDFQMDGSPPMWVCWNFLPNCVPDPNSGCSLTMLYQNQMHLSHTFTSSGYHCLDLSVRNDVSELQTSFSLYIKQTSNIHMFFILSCAAVLVATFSFITVMSCRPRRKNQSKSKSLSFSNAVFLKNEETDDQSGILLNVCAVEGGEKAPLMSQFGKQYNSSAYV